MNGLEILLPKLKVVLPIMTSTKYCIFSNVRYVVMLYIVEKLSLNFDKFSVNIKAHKEIQEKGIKNTVVGLKQSFLS